ncbi:polysaccharide pyruvyl transferase family protein [Vibrio cyclitrophicus]
MRDFINVIGYLGYSNAGDDIMLLGLLNELIDRNKQQKVRVFVRDLNISKTPIFCSEKFSNIHWVKLGRLSVFKMPWYCYDARELIWCGGTCFYEDPSDSSLSGLKWIDRVTRISSSLGVKIRFCNVGVNSVISLVAKKLIRSILLRSSAVSLRDGESLEACLDYAPEYKNFSIGGDLAFLSGLRGNRHEAMEPYFVFCGHADFSQNDELIELYASQVNMIAKKLELQVCFLPMHLGIKTDNLFHEKVIKLLGEDISYKLFDTNNLDIIAEIVSNSKFVLSFRLHALVISEILRTPSVGISYNDKVHKFINKTNNLSEQRVLDVGEALSEITILDILDNYDVHSNFIVVEENEAKLGIVIGR